MTKVECYRLYKRNSADSQKGLRLTQDQYARGGTNGTNEAIGQGVAELYNKTQNIKTQEYRNATY